MALLTMKTGAVISEGMLDDQKGMRKLEQQMKYLKKNKFDD